MFHYMMGEVLHHRAMKVSLSGGARDPIEADFGDHEYDIELGAEWEEE